MPDTSSSPDKGYQPRIEQPRWAAFWGLAITQSMNALNEKGVQSLLIALGIWLSYPLQYELSVLMVLPFVIFGPLAGWIGDRYCKTKLLQVMVLLQIFVLIGMFFGLYYHQIWVAVGFFAVFCIQAVFFSPAKKGLVKDMACAEQIGFASGIVEISSMLALLVGQIGGFYLVFYLLSIWGEQAGWEAAAWPCLICLVGAVGVFILSLRLPRFEPENHAPFRWSLLWEQFAQVKMLWKNKLLRHSEVGIGYFWFIAGVMMLIALDMASEAHAGSSDDQSFMSMLGQQRDSALLIAWISGGSILGGAFASVICSGKIRLWIAYAGGLGMVVGCTMLALTQYGDTLFYAALVMTGFSAAAFLVPLNAILQNCADNDKRGDVIAAGNLVDCFLAMLAVGVQKLMHDANVSIQMQCATLAVLSLLVTLYIIKNARTS